jgi:enoyl-CoA hydratase
MSGQGQSSPGPPVTLSTSNGVLVVTIDRPQARNAIDAETARELAKAMEHLDDDPALHCAVITGSGGTFCSGMDLKAFLAGERPSIDGRGFAGLVEAPPAKPLIAAVEGYALAGGFEIVLACDHVVAAEDASFGLPEVKRGLVAAGGGLLRLPRRAPYHLAVEWALTGRLIPAAEAHAAGLVNRLTPPRGALAAAMELAAQVVANGPLAVRATKEIIRSSVDWPQGSAFDRQRQISEPVRASDDALEGARAFRERRPPVWSGH